MDQTNPIFGYGSRQNSSRHGHPIEPRLLEKKGAYGSLNVAARIPLPNVPPEEEVCYEVPTSEAVEAIQSYLRCFEYASSRHLEFDLIVEIGIRLGAVRAINVEDVDLDEKVILPVSSSQDPSEYGTPLRNGPDGERIVNISAQLRDAVADYVDHQRADVTCD